MHSGQLVDQRQGRAEGVIGWINIRIEGRIRERIDVVEVLHLAREKHLAIHFSPPAAERPGPIAIPRPPKRIKSTTPPAPLLTCTRPCAHAVAHSRDARTGFVVVPPIYFDSICRLERENQKGLYSPSPPRCAGYARLAFSPRRDAKRAGMNSGLLGECCK